MNIRYPVSLAFTVGLAVCVAALAVMWNFIHALGLLAVIAGLFCLPLVSRWEGRRKSSKGLT